jgi:hypothetical protein
MSISPMCDKCGRELTEFGAILLSPPDDEENVKKRHICKSCYEKIEKELMQQERYKKQDTSYK